MLESDRLRIAMLLTEKLSVRTISPADDDYAGTDGHTEYRVDGIAEAAEVMAKERDLLLRLIESAERHLNHVGIPLNAEHLRHFDIAFTELTAAIALLREGKVPAELMERAG